MTNLKENLRPLFSKDENCLQILDRLSKDVDERTGYPKYPTGIIDIDNLIWGVHKKELLIIGSRPSNGKTSLSLQFAWNLAKKKTNTLFLSLEMSKDNILERIICNEYKINGVKLRKGDDKERVEYFKSLPDFNEKLIESSMTILDAHGKNIESVENVIQFYEPEVLVIDHAQKVTSTGFINKYEALSHYTNRIQDLAIKYNIAIIMNSQINRGGDYLKGCGDLEECADTLLFCEWKCKENPEYMDKKEYEISVVKQRHGACNYCLINFNAEFYNFSSKEFC